MHWFSPAKRRNTVRLLASTLAVCTGLIGLGCGSGTQNFTPSDRTTSRSPSGYVASDYDVDSNLGEFSDAKVWSRGAFTTKVAGVKRTVVHVGFELENHLNQPIAFDARGVRLDQVNAGKKGMFEVAPGWIQGQPTLAAQQARRLDVFFVLPPGIAPNDVNGFRVNWALNGGFQHYAQRTPFLKERESYGVDLTSSDPDRSNFYGNRIDPTERSEIIEHTSP
jgi:hypothetical protein